MPRYVVSTLMVIGSFVIVLTVLAGVSDAEAMTDPFAGYEAIAPGQSSVALAQYPCRYIYLPHDIVEDLSYCQIRPEHGPILLVAVTTRDNIIRTLTFSVRGMQAGHLAQRWGRPDFIRSGKGVSILDWQDGISATAQTWGWFTYQSSLTIVILRFRDTNTTLS
jgi:hypothetical protein